MFLDQKLWSPLTQKQRSVQEQPLKTVNDQHYPLHAASWHLPLFFPSYKLIKSSASALSSSSSSSFFIHHDLSLSLNFDNSQTDLLSLILYFLVFGSYILYINIPSQP